MNPKAIPPNVLAALLSVPKPVASLGTSVFLYLTLVQHAGPRGLIIRTRSRLAEDLSIEEPQIDAWLEQLAAAGVIRVQSPSPYLVLRIPSWPGHTPAPTKNAERSAVQDPESLRSGYSHTNSNAIAIHNTVRDRGAGEGEPPQANLLAAAREILGDRAEVELPAILREHSRERVTQILERVRQTPPEKIRKSKLALFRFLISHDKP